MEKTFGKATFIICDICGGKVEYDLYADRQPHRCFICKKDICDRCRVFIEKKRDDGQIDFAFICPGHLPPKIATCFDYTMASCPGDPCDGDFPTKVEILGMI